MFWKFYEIIWELLGILCKQQWEILGGFAKEGWGKGLEEVKNQESEMIN
jgi:hypothetical protein